jgi:hypothetical protein
MANYITEKDVDHPYWSSTVLSNVAPIYPDMWRAQPLDNQPLIDPRRSGFRPYVQYQVASWNPDYMPYCAVFQQPCDEILPVNRCYREDPQAWIADIFRGR